MSNTAVIEPAVPVAAVAGAAMLPLALAGAGIWQLVRAIAGQDERCADLLARSRAALRRERWATLELRSRDLERLVRGAREVQLRASTLDGDRIRLTAADGSSLWAARTSSGVRLVGTEATLRNLVVASTTSRTVEFLRSRGFQVQVKRTRSGELSLVGTGPGSRAVKVDVGAAGEARVDPVGFKGPECETLVRDLGAALEGEITRLCRKPEYHAGAAAVVGPTQRA